jgi:iron complex outermembrane recepter protein
MKRFIWIIILLFLLFKTGFPQVSLSGKVTDKSSGEALFGATVYIPDLKTGAVTNEDGQYKIQNLPKGKFLIQIKYMGYASIAEMIELSGSAVHDFSMQLSTIEAQEVVITGSAISSDNSRTSVSIVPIDKMELLTTGSANIVNALTSVPGISEITTGSGISKPVIRGLGYNHVVTLNEGVRQEGNQWGDEHGLEIDQFSADRIEILKGPASLFYGSDAMGGVINILEPIPASIGTLQGEISSNFSTNDKLTANSLMLEGNHNGFIWRIRGTYKSAASFKTPVEYVYNSGFSEINYNAMLGLNKKWGYSHLHFSKYDAYLGAVEGERDSITQKFVDADGAIVPESILKGRKLEIPFQNVQHTKVSSVSNIIIGNSQLKINIGYQTNNRKEFGESKDYSSLFFHLNTLTYDAKYQLPLRKNIEMVFGISGMTQQNQNKGVEFLVPDYNLQDIGGFAYLKKSYTKITFNAGIRYDYRRVKGHPLYTDSLGNAVENGDTLFQSFKTDFQAITGGIGFTYQINKVINVKLNIGRGYRAPNIAELASNGIHEGTFRYELGDYHLKPETSIQIDAEVSANTKFINASISGFYNIINNFIYSRNLNNEQKDVDGQFYPVYRFVQGNSLLKGFECSVDVHPIPVIHIENSISYVHGSNLSTGIPLPFIPATHSGHDIKWNIRSKKNALFTNSYIKAGITYHWKQKRYDIFETETDDYTLLNASVGTDIKMGRLHLTLFVNGENLLNVKYYDHLNRLKYAGIYNPGRNITLGIYLPFDFRLKEAKKQD